MKHDEEIFSKYTIAQRFFSDLERSFKHYDYWIESYCPEFPTPKAEKTFQGWSNEKKLKTIFKWFPEAESLYNDYKEILNQEEGGDNDETE